MEILYENIANRIQEKMKDVSWIDLDTGQLENKEYRASVDYPCILISIDYNSCDDLGHSGNQICNTSVVLRLASQVISETNMNAPSEVRAEGLKHQGRLKDVFRALHTWNHEQGEPLLRKSVREEKRNDGIKVHRLVFETNWYEYLYDEPQTKIASVPPDLVMQTGALIP